MKNRKRPLFITIIIIIISLCTIIPVLAISVGEEMNVEKKPTTNSEVYIPSEPEQEVFKPTVVLETFKYEQIYTENLTVLEQEKVKCEQRMCDAKTIKDFIAKAFYYKEDHPVFFLMELEYEQAQDDYYYYYNLIEQINVKLEKARWAKKESEYPVATQIWKYLKNLGYNDYVCAGILGNMMTETGGHTLNIQDIIYDSSGYFYGICQWSLYYCPEVNGVNLISQLDYLKKTIRKEFDTFGFVYKKDFDYADFLNIDNVEDAALAFAKAYERCSSTSYNYSTRQSNAKIAYNYFVIE